MQTHNGEKIFPSKSLISLGIYYFRIIYFNSFVVDHLIKFSVAWRRNVMVLVVIDHVIAYDARICLCLFLKWKLTLCIMCSRGDYTFSSRICKRITFYTLYFWNLLVFSIFKATFLQYVWIIINLYFAL